MEEFIFNLLALVVGIGIGYGLMWGERHSHCPMTHEQFRWFLTYNFVGRKPYLTEETIEEMVESFCGKNPELIGEPK